MQRSRGRARLDTEPRTDQASRRPVCLPTARQTLRHQTQRVRLCVRGRLLGDAPIPTVVVHLSSAPDGVQRSMR